jgi:multiple sugar transport system substrate-binding protein
MTDSTPAVDGSTTAAPSSPGPERQAGWLLRGRQWVGTRIGSLAIGVLVGTLVGALGTVVLPRLFAPSRTSIAAGTRLIVLSGQDPSGARDRRFQLWNERAAAWNAGHPDERLPEVTVVWLPTAANEQLAEMLRRARTAEDDADVYVLDAPWTRQFVSGGWLLRLDTGVDTQQFLPGPLKTCRNGDSLYALPFNTDVGLLYRRPGLRVPADWSSLVNDAAHAPARPRAAFAAPFGRGEAFVVSVIEGVLARGGSILDGEGHLTLDGPGVALALKELSHDLSDRTLISSTAVESDEAATRQTFVDGQAAYMRNWPTFTPRDHQQHPLKGMGVSRLPWRSVLGGQDLAVDAQTPYPQAATELIEWLTGESSQTQLFMDGGFAPTREAVYHDPLVLDQNRSPFAGDLLAAVQSAVRRPDVPNYPLFSRVFEDVMRRVLQTGGSLSPRDVDEITAAVDGRLLTSSTLADQLR